MPSLLLVLEALTLNQRFPQVILLFILDNYELTYDDDQSGFSQEFNGQGETRVSSAELGYSDFQGMAHTTQKEIDRACSDSEVGTGQGPNSDCDK